jgi:ATP-binding cassette, subfamily B, bacterial MsbA
VSSVANEFTQELIQKMTKRLLQYILKNYPFYFFAPLGMAFLLAVVEGAGMGMLLPLIDGLQSPEAIVPSHALSKFLEQILAYFNMPFTLPVLFIVGMSLFLIQAILEYLNVQVSARLIDKIQTSIRVNLFSALLDAELSYVNRKKVGDLVNAVVVETHRGTVAFNHLINAFVSGALALAYLVVAFVISWQLTLMAALLTLPIIYLTRKRKEIHTKGTEISQANERFQSATVEFFIGLREIKILGLFGLISEKFYEVASSVSTKERLLAVLHARFALIYQVVALAFLFLIAGVGTNAAISLPAMAAFLAILYRLSPQMTAVQKNRDKYLGLLPSFEVIDGLQAEVDASRLVHVSDLEKIRPERLQTEIEFCNVGFSYDDRGSALHAVDLSIPKGQTIAIVGSSGAGKSTLVDLVVRFYDPSEGEILVDGVNLKFLDIASWRSMIGYVSQDPFLFNDTIFNNIHYGKLDASAADVMVATKRANAHDFIQEMPVGYDTVIGDQGVMLSGGQRQRLALARAILRDPPVLILDEATSDLDTRSERLIQDALDQMRRERTIILIAHRLSTVESADQIVVLEEGHIVEQGDHQELLQIEGKYAEFYALQYGTHRTG